MGAKNYLIEGVSGSGKTTVATELERRGYHVVHGDRELAYYGNPQTGKPLEGLARERVKYDINFGQRNWIWDVGKVRSLTADRRFAQSFFCGGSRNFDQFIKLFDRVFVLDVDVETLKRRLSERPEDEFGGNPNERELIVRLHATKEDIPKGDVVVDCTAPIERVVDEILSKC